ncbi:dephospho-CoA kinase, partial [Anaerolineae bacterium CFX7]|nr:dephospho-CoA kinase [Anaerolineae bacterium CFX7]
MYLIGLTGNIATGKSTVCDILTQLGARVIDADLVAHAVLRRGSAAWRQLVQAFGYDILQYDGTVDRRKLGALVFDDAEKLQTLEQLTHPAVGTELALMIRDALDEPDADTAILVVEAVKLYESGIHEFMDALWVVTAPRAEQKRRLMQDRGMSQAEAEARLNAQPALKEKLERAAVTIDNGGSIETLRVQVMRAFVEINPAQTRDKTALLQKWLRLAPAPPTIEPTSAPNEPLETPAPPPAIEPTSATSESVETPASPPAVEAASAASEPVETSPAPPAIESAPAASEPLETSPAPPPAIEPTSATSEPAETPAPIAREPEWSVRRARPADARMLSELLARIEGRDEPIGREEMLERFGKFGYWLAYTDDQPIALAAWQAENLAAIVRELWAEND